MAWTASAIPEQEFCEPLHDLDSKAEKLAEKIRQSKHFIAFTGAGISTSAGIPDFRGPDGNWTLRAQGKTRTGPTTNTLQAIPTLTHMALVELQNRGFLKYLISQNCDGLHRRSGILPEHLSELHGNSNREYCKSCGKDYIRDFRAVATYEKSDWDHRTGRKCACGDDLHDSIINFGESLPEIPLDLAHHHAKLTDLCLVLGSSLTVTPANEIPESVALRRSRRAVEPSLVICNLQKTPQDKLSQIRVFSKTDALMARVMDKLGIAVPPFILRRRIIIVVEQNERGKCQVNVLGVDTDGTPVSFLRSVRLLTHRRLLTKEPFCFTPHGGIEAGAKLDFELEFMGHYCEPKLILTHEYSDDIGKSLYLLEYDPSTGRWTVVKHGGELLNE
ncbi:unnamed protein product [Clonostachys rosea f. rosea IK726]|uniref:protein acetyllysine N-acetyltransferase n=2 Tax=Bionectria ochroleuca TaxID=29856 RepID=A0A0B7KCQ3_BIOOC|nr:unnamed protein product [Clonostachys rosea f. rosea IK726]